MTIATRQAYLDTAVRILGQQGRGGLRIGTLCRALGVTSGSFYHHFGGWERFVTGLLEHWEGEEVTRIVTLVGRCPDPVERVGLLKHLAATLPHAAENALRAWAGADEQVAVVVRRVDRRRGQAIVDVLAPLIEDEAVRRRLAAVGMSLLVGHQQLAAGSAVDLPSVLDEFEALVHAHRTGHWDAPPVTAPVPWEHEAPRAAEAVRAPG